MFCLVLFEAPYALHLPPATSQRAPCASIRMRCLRGSPIVYLLPLDACRSETSGATAGFAISQVLKLARPSLTLNQYYHAHRSGGQCLDLQAAVQLQPHLLSYLLKKGNPCFT